MANRQYIGARYVPKFAEPMEWNIGFPYEALTIVTHLGNSYTSKIPVPPNIEITNTKYWALTGNYNAQVDSYREEVAEIKSQLEITQDDLATLTTEFDNIKCVNVKDFGAKGDNVTDDSAAFQAAFDTGKNVYVPGNNGERYLIKSTLNVNNIRQAFFGDVQNLPTGTSTGQIVFDWHLTEGIKVNASDVRFYNLCFSCNYTPPSEPRQTVFINAKNLASPQDLDIYITDCMFYKAHTVLQAFGRGIEFKRNAVISTYKMIVSSYQSESSPPLRAKYGYRNITISNNRMHVISGRIFENTAGDLTSFVFTENQSDVGTFGLIFAGKLIGGIIANNEINFCSSTALILNGGAEGLIVANNNFVNDATVNQPGAMILVPNTVETLEGVTVIGNTFIGSSSVAINLQAQNNNNVSITGNYFSNLGSATTSMPCALSNSFNHLVITGNTFVPNGQTNTAMLYSFNATFNDANIGPNAGVNQDTTGAIKGSVRGWLRLFQTHTATEEEPENV